MVTIITNNQPRELLCASDLTAKELEEFDYLDEPDELGYNFFRYRGQVYSLDNFMRVNASDETFAGWHGSQGMTYFSGVLMRYTDCGDGCVVGRYWQ